MRGQVWVLLCLVLSVGANGRKSRRVTNINFYIHAKVSKPNETAVIVAGPGGNTTGVNFGTVYVFDDVLRSQQSNTSSVVGRAKGIAMVTEENRSHATFVFSAVLQTPSYNGSISYQGTDSVSELAILGGTGDFRLVYGFANFTHVQLNLPDSIVFVNSTLYHLLP